MKIKDIIVEQTGMQAISPDQKAVFSKATFYPQMDNNYELYRFGISMAASPNAKTPTTGVGDVPIIYAYSKGDEDIIKATEKHHKIKGQHVSATDSGEPEGTYKVSPTAKPKRNKYGV
jgi:hypothetical protein